MTGTHIAIRAKPAAFPAAVFPPLWETRVARVFFGVYGLVDPYRAVHMQRTSPSFSKAAPAKHSLNHG